MEFDKDFNDLIEIIPAADYAPTLGASICEENWDRFYDAVWYTGDPILKEDWDMYNYVPSG